MHTSKESSFRTYWQSFVAPNGSEFCIFAPIFLKCLNNRKFQWARPKIPIFARPFATEDPLLLKKISFRNFSVKCKPEFQSADCTPRNNHLTTKFSCIFVTVKLQREEIDLDHPSSSVLETKILFNIFPKNIELNRSRSLPVLELFSVRRSLKILRRPKFTSVVVN